MNKLCERCKGACCETLAIVNPPIEFQRMVEGRTLASVDGTFFLGCRCRHLTKEGKCGVYEDRPLMCKTFEVLGPQCVESLKALRPLLYAELVATGEL